MDLCVGCKGCKRECPTGVDMARMKIEFLHQYRKRHGMRPWDRLVCALPEIGPKLAKFPVAMAWFNWLQTQAPVKWLLRRLLGLSPERDLPAWRTDYFGARATDTPMPTTETDVVLWVDTFTRWFEPDNARAALAVLTAAGYQVEVAGLSDMIVRCPDDASTRTILTKELAPDSMTMCRVLTPNPSNSSLIMRPTKSSPILPRNVVDVPSFARVTSAVATLPPPC